MAEDFLKDPEWIGARDKAMRDAQLEEQNAIALEPSLAKYSIDLRITTCYTCKEVGDCTFAFDTYNTNGDCLKKDSTETPS